MNMYCEEHGTLDFCPYCIEQNSPESKIKEAAPALLDALELIKDKVWQHIEMNMSDEDIAKIDAAIAAAKGEV
jgi:hypothetical protein